MKLINFTIVKLTIGLIVGILIAYFKPFSVSISLIACVCVIVTTLIVKLQLRNTSKSFWFGVLVYVSIVFTGILTTVSHNQKNFNSHYSHVSNKNPLKNSVTFRIREVLKPNTYYHKYVIDLLYVNSKKVSGKAMLNVKKDSLFPTLETDDILITTQPFKTIQKPLNPEQFNYQNYLKRQYIYHQITCETDELFSLSKKKHTFLGQAAKLRTHIKSKLKNYPFKPKELAIINALILGQRQDISKTTYERYSKAGVIHILAVSGLHIGIILLFLSTLLKPLERIKNGRTYKITLILILLWSFAIIAGLSASITRAVTMFSIVTIGTHLKRPINIYNTLTLSLFILLLFKPLYLFDVGFQLSYAAVFAIVSIQPLFMQLWQPKWFLVRKVWQIITVSFAAQIGVLPFSLFYFHQFPGLFLFSNLVIIPCLGFILGLGILVIVLALLNGLPEFLATLYGIVIHLLNQFIGWVSLQDEFIFQDLSFNKTQLVIAYFFIIVLVRCLTQINYKRVALLLIAIILFQGVLINNKYDRQIGEFIIFHKVKETVIAKRKGTFLKFYSNLEALKLKRNFISYTIANGIKTISNDSIAPIYNLKNKYLLVIDRDGVYQVTRFCPDYILLTNTPKINLNRMIDSIQPRFIIADGSNYKAQVLKWKKTCKNKKIPFHDTYEKGAFVLKND